MPIGPLPAIGVPAGRHKMAQLHGKPLTLDFPIDLRSELLHFGFCHFDCNGNLQGCQEAIHSEEGVSCTFFLENPCFLGKLRKDLCNDFFPAL